MLRDLRSAKERTFEDVIEYSISKDARALVYAVGSKKDGFERSVFGGAGHGCCGGRAADGEGPVHETHLGLPAAASWHF